MNIKWIFSLILFPFLLNAQTNKLPKAKHNFIVVAHRGDHTEAPENTLLAYQNAIKAGADYVEIDLRTTKDSQLVIMHDASLMRMAGLNKKVQECIYDSIKNLLIRDVNHPEWGSHKIPGFEEVLKLCKGKINIYLDFKDASVEQAYKAIVAHKMEKHVVVYINAPQQFIDWRRIAPAMPLMISLPKKIATKSMMDSVLTKYPIDILDGNYNEYTIETVQASQARGIPIWADIQGRDEDQHWLTALSLGINGLQTDHPKALIDFLKNQKKR
ncbi:MAG: glycerophosphodiester phosphodiesterase family protein [Sediminibacterium sp.]|jgi:glycerophosphoryl diester phosphodiesterase|nr:glycerophosphodiester phosphodiesterase family protein [Chitinophagaceae bacterium]MCA6446855.1 glycerophosphodiester phosphodiesterase family protein [Chitinophagaceae bacterium]